MKNLEMNNFNYDQSYCYGSLLFDKNICIKCKRYIENYKEYDKKYVWYIQPVIRKNICKIRVVIS